MKRIKIQDIADSLQVSRVTVWKVLNNKEGVSEDMKNKVLQKNSQTVE
jgi:LacI family transcriptional regulator